MTIPPGSNFPVSLPGFSPSLPEAERFAPHGFATQEEIAWSEHPDVPQVAFKDYLIAVDAHPDKLVIHPLADPRFSRNF